MRANECNCCVLSVLRVGREVQHQALAGARLGPGEGHQHGAGPRGARAPESGPCGGMTIGGGPAPSGPWAGRAYRSRGLPRRPHCPAQPPPEHTKSRAGGYAREGTRPQGPGWPPLASWPKEGAGGLAPSATRAVVVMSLARYC